MKKSKDQIEQQLNTRINMKFNPQKPVWRLNFFF